MIAASGERRAASGERRGRRWDAVARGRPLRHRDDPPAGPGSVAFGAARTLAEVAALPALADELARRDGTVPVLRLPWPAEGAPPEGFATEVVLPLRPGARGAVAVALDALEAELLLALPGL